MAFYGASASDLRPGIGALRQHAWDGYVEPSSSEGKYVRKPLKKQASIFISEEDHAKLTKKTTTGPVIYFQVQSIPPPS